MPKLILVAGPNGVGKTTFAKLFLYKYEQVNGDEIAKRLGVQDIPNASHLIGEEYNKVVEEHLKNKKSFVIENNLESSSSLNLVIRAKELGYQTFVLFFGIDDLDLLSQRIAERVIVGEHYIPKDVVKQRFESAIRNIPLALKKADVTEFIDNSIQNVPPRRIGLYCDNRYFPEPGINREWIKPILEKIEKEQIYLSKLKAKGITR